MGTEELSKVVSHALRHEPWLYKLELDAEGWVPVDQLLDALHAKGGAWRGVDRAALVAMIESSDKRSRTRWRPDPCPLRPFASRADRDGACTAPEYLFHGTAPETWEVVRFGRNHAPISEATPGCAR